MNAGWGAIRRLCWLAGPLAAMAPVLSVPVAAAASAKTCSAGPSAQASGSQAGSADAEQLLREGQSLLKAHRYEAAADKLRSATAEACEQGRPAEKRAFTYYLLGLAESGAKCDEAAIRAFRKALALSPGRAEIRLDLAQALLNTGRPLDAQAEVRHGILMGLSEKSDQVDAKDLLKAARAAVLRERLSAHLALSFGYDSNVLVGTLGLCSEADCAGTASVPASLSNLAQVRLLRRHPSDAAAISSLYTTPWSRQEWDLPVAADVELGVRAYGTRTIEVGYEYRFRQDLLASAAYDHDSYNFQEHSAPMYVLWNPRPWLLLHPQVEGFVNFTGLKTFTPFQGGIRAQIEAVFFESARWVTSVFYLNQARGSFDRIRFAYLDGDRSDIRVMQELRLTGRALGLRARLSYRFRSEGSGVFDTRGFDDPVPFSIPARPHGAVSAPLQTLGWVDYVEPLSYQGHEVAARCRLYAPAGFTLATGLSYEYRRYAALPSAPVFYYPDASPQRPPFTLPAQQRRDSLIGFDGSVRKSLGGSFAIELAYTLTKNFSTLANWLDNRNFSKHTVVTTFSYAF